MIEIFEKTFYGNTVLQWLISLGIIAGAYIFSKLIYWVFKNVLKKAALRTKSGFDDLLVEMVEKPVILAVVLLGFHYGLKNLTMSDSSSDFFSRVFYIAIIFDVSWLLVRFIDSLIKNYLEPLVKKSDSDLDDQLLPIISKTVKAVIWIIAVVVGLNNAGYEVGTIIAGLGLGGLAFAMAAKDSVSNLFGGITIFMDKPFKINDRIIVDGYDGNVVEIGVRSTRLRTLSGRLVTIPNKKFTDSNVENVTSEPSRKILITLGLHYSTSADKMQNALDTLIDINSKNVFTDENVYVGFVGFGQSTLDIMFIYYIKAGEDIFKVQTDVNKEILRRFNEEGLVFAYPTHTIYTKAN